MPYRTLISRTLASRHTSPIGDRQGEEGYLLIGLVVVLFLIALFLTIAAPTVARQLERDRELESEHRAQQYVQALHNYYFKFKTYPTSLDNLLSQNDMHFLRQQYKDPLTGGDYRLIHFGEAKTEVKGFFGEPLEGISPGNLGALSGSASSQGGAAGSFGTGGFGAAAGPQGGGASVGTSSFGNSFGSGSGGAGGSSGGTSSFGNSFGSGQAGNGGSGAPATPGAGGADPTASGNSTNASGTLGGNSATTFQGSKGAIVGVGSSKSGPGVIEWNGSANIEDWEFLYDPRVDVLKARVSLLGGSIGANGSGSLGTLGGSSSSLGSNTSSFGNSFGNGSSNQTGSSPSAPSGSPPASTGANPTPPGSVGTTNQQ